MYALSPESSFAQNMDGLRVAPGSRIRVTSAVESQPITGSLSAIAEGSLMLATTAGPRMIPSPSVSRVDQSLGHRRLRYAVVGGLIGVAVGSAVGAYIGNRDHDPLGAAAGFIVGARSVLQPAASSVG